MEILNVDVNKQNELPKILCFIFQFQLCGKNAIRHTYIVCTDLILCRILKPCRAVTCQNKVSQLKQWVTSFSPQRPGFIPTNMGYLAKPYWEALLPVLQLFHISFHAINVAHYCMLNPEKRQWAHLRLQFLDTASHQSQSHNGGGQGRWFCKTTCQTLVGRLFTGNNKLQMQLCGYVQSV